MRTLGRMPASLLRDAGHDVRRVPDQGLSGVADRLLIEACRDEERALVTPDTDFANPIAFNPLHYGGVAVLRLPTRSTPDDLRERVRTLIRGLERGSLEGKLWVVHQRRIAEYPPHNGAQDNAGSVP